MGETMSAAKEKTWLRQWREREGLTQTECAEHVGVSHNRWSEIENGAERRPSFDVAVAIERFTGIPPRDFFRVEPIGRKFQRKG